jgi:hypothetical protein
MVDLRTSCAVVERELEPDLPKNNCDHENNYRPTLQPEMGIRPSAEAYGRKQINLRNLVFFSFLQRSFLPAMRGLGLFPTGFLEIYTV